MEASVLSLQWTNVDETLVPSARMAKSRHFKTTNLMVDRYRTVCVFKCWWTLTWDEADRTSPQLHARSDAGLLNWTRRKHFLCWSVRYPLAVDNVLSLFYLAGWPESTAPLFVDVLRHLPYLAAAFKMATVNWTDSELTKLPSIIICID